VQWATVAVHAPRIPCSSVSTISQIAGDAALLQWRQSRRLGPLPPSALLSNAGGSLCVLYAAAVSVPVVRDHAGDLARINAELAADGGELVQARGDES